MSLRCALVAKLFAVWFVVSLDILHAGAAV
jgi:hypothetical protein